MSDAAGVKPREPILERLRRLGLRNEPANSQLRRVFRTKRYRRDLDEITFNKPNANKTK
jgi:hypothetical protein